MSGQPTGSLGFNISNCIGFEPRTNDEVTYSQIKTRKGHRAIHLEKLTGAAQGKKRPNVQRSGIDFVPFIVYESYSMTHRLIIGLV